MRFGNWLKTQPRGTIERLHVLAGGAISRETLRRTAKGRLLHSYPRAKLLSELTGGAVSIRDLCEPAADDAEEQNADDAA